MPQVALTTLFLEALKRFPRQHWRKIESFVRKFQADPTSSGLNYEAIRGARDAKLRSVRIDDMYRAIVVHPTKGDIYRLVWVDRHDDAYAWARNRVFSESHDGSQCQLIVENVAEVEQRIDAQSASGGEQRAFAGLSDDDLRSINVPDELIPLLRQIQSVEVLPSLGNLVAGHVLYALECLAHGDPVKDVQEYVVAEEAKLQAQTVVLLGSSRTPAAGTVANSLEAWLEAAECLPAVHDFGGYREEKHRHFSDRPWLREEVLAWFVHANERALLITGNFGTGKTAFLTDLVQRNPEDRILAYHFCQADTPDTLRPSFFVRNVAAMLRDRLPGYGAALADAAVANALTKENCEEDPASAFELGIVTPLHRLSPPGEDAYYIVVDSLDEALLWKGQGTSIVDLLSTRAERLPSWLRLVLTSRPQPEIRSRFSNITFLAIDPEVSDAVDEVRAANIRADAERHIHKRLQEPNFAEWLQHNAQDVHHAAATILDKSEANFLYVRMLFDDLERHGSRGFFNLDDLPRGLNGLFHGFFKRHFPNPKKQDYAAARKVLEVVLAADEPPDEDLLAGATGLDPDGGLPELLEKLSDFLQSRKDARAVDRYEEDRVRDEWEEEPGEQEQSREEARAVDRFSFVNLAIDRWLTDPKRAREYHANPKKGHKQLAQFFLARYEEVRWLQFDGQSKCLRFALRGNRSW